MKTLALLTLSVLSGSVIADSSQGKKLDVSLEDMQLNASKLQRSVYFDYKAQCLIPRIVFDMRVTEQPSYELPSYKQAAKYAQESFDSHLAVNKHTPFPTVKEYLSSHISDFLARDGFYAHPSYSSVCTAIDYSDLKTK